MKHAKECPCKVCAQKPKSKKKVKKKKLKWRPTNMGIFGQE